MTARSQKASRMWGVGGVVAMVLVLLAALLFYVIHVGMGGHSCRVVMPGRSLSLREYTDGVLVRYLSISRLDDGPYGLATAISKKRTGTGEVLSESKWFHREPFDQLWRDVTSSGVFSIKGQRSKADRGWYVLSFQEGSTNERPPRYHTFTIGQSALTNGHPVKFVVDRTQKTFDSVIDCFPTSEMVRGQTKGR